jgi:hypothetical protein
VNWFERIRRAVAGDAEGTAIVQAAERDTASGISRRHFLRYALAGAAVAATVDVDQLLWSPSDKTILLPGEPAWQTFTITDHVWSDAEIDIAERYIRPAAQSLARAIDDDLARIWLENCQQSLKVLSRVNRQYADNFNRLKVGDTINIRLPHRFSGKPVEKRLARAAARLGATRQCA